jgi:hypothetical protein
MDGHTAFNWSLAYLPAVLSRRAIGEPVVPRFWRFSSWHESPSCGCLRCGFILPGINFASRKQWNKKTGIFRHFLVLHAVKKLSSLCGCKAGEVGMDLHEHGVI